MNLLYSNEDSIFWWDIQEGLTLFIVTHRYLELCFFFPFINIHNWGCMHFNNS